MITIKKYSLKILTFKLFQISCIYKIFMYKIISSNSDFVSTKNGSSFRKKQSSRALKRFEEPRNAISVKIFLRNNHFFLNRLVLKLRYWVEAQHDQLIQKNQAQ